MACTNVAVYLIPEQILNSFSKISVRSLHALDSLLLVYSLILRLSAHRIKQKEIVEGFPREFSWSVPQGVPHGTGTKCSPVMHGD